VPFLYISNLARDDVTVKLIFDHFRNIGIATLVGLAAAWQFQHVPSSGGQYFLSLAIASALSVTTFVLWFLNYEHFLHKLEGTTYGKPLKVAITSFYAFVATGLLTYLLRSNS
jgi:hypothetical protein